MISTQKAYNLNFPFIFFVVPFFHVAPQFLYILNTLFTIAIIGSIDSKEYKLGNLMNSLLDKISDNIPPNTPNMTAIIILKAITSKNSFLLDLLL
jgi:hypothetical protein